MSYTLIDDIHLEALPQPKKQGMLLPSMPSMPSMMPSMQQQAPNPYVRTVHDNFNVGGANPIINRMMNNNSPYPIQNHSQKVREMINTPLPQQHGGMNINRTQYGTQGQPLFQNVPQRNIRTNVTPTISLFVNQQQNDNDQIQKNHRNNFRHTSESEIKKSKKYRKQDDDDDDEGDDKDGKYELYDKPHKYEKKEKYMKRLQQEQEIDNDVMFQIQHMSTIFRNHMEKVNDNVLFLQQKVENLATMMKFLFVIIIILFIMFLRK